MQAIVRVALVVDDEPFARLSATQVLVDQGYLVLEACHAAEALDLLDRNDDVSIVVTDINMPGEMNGLALAQHIRSRDETMALVVTSGFEAPERAELAPSACFLPKPYAAHALLECVREVEAMMRAGRNPWCRLQDSNL
jgi:DNA-binding NtrC family response regulator